VGGPINTIKTVIYAVIDFIKTIQSKMSRDRRKFIKIVEIKIIHSFVQHVLN